MSIVRLTADDQLRMYNVVTEHLPYEMPVELFDFTLCHDIISNPATYHLNGFKNVQEYVLANGVVVVRKLFKYTPDAVEITIEWLTLENETGLRKVITKPINSIQWKSLQSAARHRIIHTLASTVAGSQMEPYYNQLLEHYVAVVDIWLLDGTSAWSDAMEAEPESIDGTANPFHTVLNIVTELDMTVLEFIQMHINAS